MLLTAHCPDFYMSFDDAASAVLKLGRGALLGKVQYTSKKVLTMSP